jgi:uncharacterized protein (TIGR02646 family)
MYRLPDTNLSQGDIDALALQQAYVDAGASFADKVERAKAKFGSKPKALFTRIRKRLTEMSGDLQRCNYCEDSLADEVEHVRPKDFYPELVFRWENYLFACGPCNGPKNNKCSIRTAAGTAIDLREHRATHGVVPPPDGIQLLIDPRNEDPLEYLWLDMGGGLASATFRFSVFDEGDDIKSARARTTMDVLGLNRDVLAAARENAFDGYADRISQYVNDKLAGASQTTLNARIASLRKTPHRTVWLEMKRQRAIFPSIEQHFVVAPEALDW